MTVDFIDLLRHSTGLCAPDAPCIGPGGRIIFHEDDLIRMLNLMPTADTKGQRFNCEWEYNNYTYGLIAKVVEQLSGQQFADFLRERILRLLGMTRKALSRADVAGEGNTAPGCVKRDDGTFSQLGGEPWPCEDHSPLFAATGIQSSLNDMLTWYMAVLAGEREEHQEEQKSSDTQSNEFTPHTNSRIRNNPLKQMKRVWRGYWTRPADDPSFSREAAYGMGWFLMELPSSRLSALIGNSGLERKNARCI